ncbi:MAG TPA: ATP-binding protein [Candidatus Portnoybacteria bacterium]|nr:ATP-binding protein [Candidatus Portnoybacteria bacterium]
MSRIGFHQGEALLRVAGVYHTLHDSILELVQNAIDAKAQNIFIFVNYLGRKCSVSDDGVGVAKKDFEEALMKVCHSIKDDTKLGKFGMGNISPLGKCDTYTFTSACKDAPTGYLRWIFNTENIRQQEKINGIPLEAAKEFRFDRNGKTKGGVPWRTQIRMIGLTKDKSISRVNAGLLREGILERYNIPMKRLGTTIHVNIITVENKQEQIKFAANEYDGEKLPLERFQSPVAGKTEFNLYLAKKTAVGRKGKVIIGEIRNPFRLAFSQFSRQLKDYLSAEAIRDLNSGIFEGEITGEKISIAPSRKHFLMDDALIDFCIAIEEWYKKIGSIYAEKVKEEAQDGRYQRLGLRSIRVIEELLKLTEFSHLKEVIKSFSKGTIGVRHVEPLKKIIGLQPQKSLSTQGDGKKEKSGDIVWPVKSSPEKEHEGHTPLTVAGPIGRQRAVVKSNSLGLQFAYGEMRGSEKLWDLNRGTGILTFNTRHPLWAKCEADEKALMRFQESIAIEALTLEMAPDDLREQHRRLADEKMPVLVFWLLKGDEITGRKPGSALKQYQARKKTA